jgi:hypothetical protein
LRSCRNAQPSPRPQSIPTTLAESGDPLGTLVRLDAPVVVGGMPTRTPDWRH